MGTIRTFLYMAVTVGIGLLVNLLFAGSKELDKTEKRLLYVQIILLTLYVSYKFNKIGGGGD